MDSPVRRIPMLLCYVGLLMSMPIGGRTCFSASGTSSSTSECDLLPTHVCHVTTYYMEDVLVSNETVWTCTNNDVASLHCTPNCCSYDNIIDAVVNLTRGATTEIECSEASSNPTFVSVVHTLEMNAPPGSQVLLTVPNYDAENTITATDGEDSDNTNTFNPDSFVTGGDYFLSSSSTVNIQAIFTNSAQTQNVAVIAQPLIFTDTITVTSGPQQCAVSPPVTGGNQWYTGTECDDGMYNFNESCYQFNTGKIKQSTSLTNCEDVGYHLVYIESSEEQAFLVDTISMTTPQEKEYWIGIERNAQGERVWMDGSAITYSNFGLMDGIIECFQMRQQESYMWADHDCNHRHAYICERERGYIGYNPAHWGCIDFSGTLPTNVNNEGAILLKFSYIIKTLLVLQDAGGTRITGVWTGNYLAKCLPSYMYVVDINGLQVEVSCDYTLTPSWEVTFQARGTGMVQINNVQLLIYEETEPPTTGPSSMSSTPMLYTTSTPSASQHSTDLDTSLATLQSRLLPQTTSPTSPTTLSHNTKYIDPNGDGLSSGVNSAVISTIVFLLIFTLIIVIIGGVCFFRRRRISSASLKQGSQPNSSGACVKNPTFNTDTAEQHEYTEFRDSIKIHAKSNHSEVLEDIEQHEYSELPSSDPTPKHDDLTIYNEVGEEDYNVLFGGKEQGEYHEYNLPDSDQGKAGAVVPGERHQEGGNRYFPKVTAVNGTTPVDLDNKSQGYQNKDGEPADYSYQDLQERDDESYTPLQLGPKAASDHARDATRMNADAPYDVLHGSTKLTEPSFMGDYDSLRLTNDAKEDFECPDSKEKTPLDYGNSIPNNGDEPYDHLQHRSMSGAPLNMPSITKLADDDDYEIPNGADTYQTLDNPESNQDGEYSDNKVYSHLQRPLETKPSPDPTAISHTDNQYGKLYLH